MEKLEFSLVETMCVFGFGAKIDFLIKLMGKNDAVNNQRVYQAIMFVGIDNLQCGCLTLGVCASYMV